MRTDILRFLDNAVLIKPEDQRTPLDVLLLDTGRVFTDALLRYERAGKGAENVPPKHARTVTDVLRSYNEINREHAIRNVDVEALEAFRDRFESDGE
jgi:hypothetical protein